LVELDNLYLKYKHIYSSDDPVWSLHNFKDKKDIEVFGLIASSYAYGQIRVMNKFLNELLNRIDNKPYDFIFNFDLKRDGKILKEMNYRFNNEYDLINLIENIRINILKYGSLKNLFLNNYSDNDENILKALRYFSDSLRNKYINKLKGYDYLMPDVSKGSTCKRLNLFLRWMVRKDEVDTGIWSKEVDKSKLLMPVDVHVYRQARKMKLIKRTSCDMKFAIELTNKLKIFDPTDPVKYDFALCHDDI
jgi:uncharacterized protein (TIGR02757 family)